MSCAIESRQFVLFWVIPDFDSLGCVAIDITGSHPWGAPTQGRAPVLPVTLQFFLNDY